ncbi:hypothetical protein Ae201684_016617 [Aphanomyces euteiches]|uniref:FYVE-type domain-containing protein n=1 Tax=Aphanomyces euteiches TaxID=100861 RepID=A0A6G0WEK6_9STRA|nr:hypothetical protein Ae201684_016617 [Aphanomyces euteiches]
MAFPVPPDFFRCPSLGRQEHANLMATATTVVKNMMHLQHLDGSIRWKLHSQDGGLHLYQGANPTAPPQTCTWMGVLEVLASVHDVASLFGLNDTQSFRESGKFAFKDMLDGIVLYTLDESVYSWTGIRWLASTGGVPGLVKPRDYCYIESQGFFKQSQNRGWFLALRSIPLPCCPDLEATLGLVRGEILDSGITVMELRDRPGFVRVTHLFQQVARGGVPEWVVRNGVKNRIKHVGQLDQALKRRLLSSTPFLSEAQLVPITARSKCFLCQKKFGSFGKKTQCRKCGEVHCANCTQAWELCIDGTNVQHRVCSSCSMIKLASSKQKRSSRVDLTQSERMQAEAKDSPYNDYFASDDLYSSTQSSLRHSNMQASEISAFEDPFTSRRINTSRYPLPHDKSPPLTMASAAPSKFKSLYPNGATPSVCDESESLTVSSSLTHTDPPRNDLIPLVMFSPHQSQ